MSIDGFGAFLVAIPWACRRVFEEWCRILTVSFAIRRPQQDVLGWTRRQPCRCCCSHFC